MAEYTYKTVTYKDDGVDHEADDLGIAMITEYRIADDGTVTKMTEQTAADYASLNPAPASGKAALQALLAEIDEQPELPEGVQLAASVNEGAPAKSASSTVGPATAEGIPASPEGGAPTDGEELPASETAGGSEEVATEEPA